MRSQKYHNCLVVWLISVFSGSCMYAQSFVSFNEQKDGSTFLDISTQINGALQQTAHYSCNYLCSGIHIFSSKAPKSFFIISDEAGFSFQVLGTNKSIHLNDVNSSWAIVENATSIVQEMSGDYSALLCFMNIQTKRYHRTLISLESGTVEESAESIKRVLKPIFNGSNGGSSPTPLLFAWRDNEGLRLGKDVPAPQILKVDNTEFSAQSGSGAFILAADENVLILEPYAKDDQKGERSAWVYRYGLKTWQRIELNSPKSVVHLFYPWIVISCSSEDREAHESGAMSKGQMLLLENLQNGQKMKIAVNSGDTEPLLIYRDRLFYRTADGIYSKNLSEDVASNSTLLFAKSGVSEIHWAFP